MFRLVLRARSFGNSKLDRHPAQHSTRVHLPAAITVSSLAYAQNLLNELENAVSHAEGSSPGIPVNSVRELAQLTHTSRTGVSRLEAGIEDSRRPKETLEAKINMALSRMLNARSI
jgi:hypothetical protein